MDKLDYLEQPIPPAPIPTQASQQVAPEALAAHAAWVKGSKLISGIMLMTMEPEIQLDLENLSAYEMLQELKTLFAQKADQGFLQPVQNFSITAWGRRALEEELSLGLRVSRKLKPGALSLYVGNGQREAVEAIGSYHLSLPSGLVIVLNNCHYAPSITRGIILVSCLYDDGYVNCFVNNRIQVSRNNMVYFSAIPRDGIFEIDLYNSYANDSSIYSLSNKRSKLDLDSALLWNCRLGHISKKCIEKLQHDRLLNLTNLRAFDKCVPCMSGKMTFRAIRILIAIPAFYDYKIWQMVSNTTFLNGYLSEKRSTWRQHEGFFVNPKYRNRGNGYSLKDKNQAKMDKIEHENGSESAWKKSPSSQKQHQPEDIQELLRKLLIDVQIMSEDLTDFINTLNWNRPAFCYDDDDDDDEEYTFAITPVLPTKEPDNSLSMRDEHLSTIPKTESNKLIKSSDETLSQSQVSPRIFPISKRYHLENSKRESIPMQEKLRLSKSQGASTPAELKRMQNVPYASAMGSIMYALMVSCYTDAGHLTDADALKSQTGYVFILNGGVVDWKSAKQSIFATSSAEAEYIAAYDASKEAV
ncbi:zinc finger, CCHC-type containing protein [Tanacetum coccineum]